MRKLELETNECVIIKNDRVLHGGVMANYADELILTNLNVIYVKKGLFGGIKKISKFPVSQIKIYNGQAQALLGKHKNGNPCLELYFSNGEESFGFEKKSEVSKWIKEINRLLLGEDADAAAGQFAIPGAEFLAETIKDTANVFMGALGIKPKEPEMVSVACPSCRASLSGQKGKTICCNYCNTYITL